MTLQSYHANISADADKLMSSACSESMINYDNSDCASQSSTSSISSTENNSIARRGQRIAGSTKAVIRYSQWYLDYLYHDIIIVPLTSYIYIPGIVADLSYYLTSYTYKSGAIESS